MNKTPTPQTESPARKQFTSEQVSKLTDDELRVKVAELCGWKWDSHFVNDKHWHKGELLARRIVELPNYTADLNVMHEVEKMLTHEQQTKYVNQLRRGLDRSWWSTLHATARQRAEAFVLTMQ